jgi:hypothetical protein
MIKMYEEIKEKFESLKQKYNNVKVTKAIERQLLKDLELLFDEEYEDVEELEGESIFLFEGEETNNEVWGFEISIEDGIINIYDDID